MHLASDHWLADRNSACPAMTVPSKRHQTPLASPLALLSPCPPRGTRCHSQVRLPCCHCALQEAPDALASQARPLLVSIVFIFDWCSYCTPQAGTATNGEVTIYHKLVLPPTVQLLYATSWYCPTLQLLHATSWYCHQLNLVLCSYFAIPTKVPHFSDTFF